MLCAFFFLATISSPETFGRRNQNVRTGPWGGPHIGIQVEADRASVEFDCAHGSMEQSIAPDNQGHFDVTGFYVQEHGGPILLDEPPDIHPARYTGHVYRKTMSITVTLTDTMEIVGRFTLFFGQSPYVTKCL
jgi:hypothetical protein